MSDNQFIPQYPILPTEGRPVNDRVLDAMKDHRAWLLTQIATYIGRRDPDAAYYFREAALDLSEQIKQQGGAK